MRAATGRRRGNRAGWRLVAHSVFDFESARAGFGGLHFHCEPSRNFATCANQRIANISFQSPRLGKRHLVERAAVGIGGDEPHGEKVVGKNALPSLDWMIHEADTALYAAKSDGRNCVRTLPFEASRSGGAYQVNSP